MYFKYIYVKNFKNIETHICNNININYRKQYK